MNNKVFWSDAKMPSKFVEPFTYKVWQQSLTELACDSSEVRNIKNCIFPPGQTFYPSTPIDITSITTIRDCETYKLDECNSSS
jgi:hypothetical protein